MTEKNLYNLSKTFSMKNLTEEAMHKIQGGCDRPADGFLAGFTVAISGLAGAMLLAGPVGWGPAIVLGAGALVISHMC